MNDWPLDQAYMIQQFHNWWSGYPTVTLQPGDLRSGFPGEKPFEENHKKWIYLLFKIFYRAWPQPETLILVYAALVSLSVVTLYLFLTRLGLNRTNTAALLLCWMFYPLQQKIAAYTFCDPLSMSGTFYFFYLWLLCSNSRFSVIGGLMLLLPREETCLLILPTFLLLPQKWKTLLIHLACLVPCFLFSKHGGGTPFAYASMSFNPSFITNFILTQTILWVLALVNAPALFIALAFMLGMICIGGEIYFRFPFAFVGASFAPPGGFYYYGPMMPALMAAVALGIARLKTNQHRLRQVCLALLLAPGIIYAAGQLLLLTRPTDEARQIESFKAASVPPDAVVVTDASLSAAFANRDQLYVYQYPPRSVSVPEMFTRADFAFVLKTDSPGIQSTFLQPSIQPWRVALTTTHYLVFKKD